MPFLITSRDIDSFLRIGEFSVKEECLKVRKLESEEIVLTWEGYGDRFTEITAKKDVLEVKRDCLGSKPIYYMEVDDEFFMSDRIKILLDFTKPEPNTQVAKDYLHSGLVNHGRKTFFQGINQLRPREKLSYVEGNLEIEEVNYQKKSSHSSPEKSIRESVLERIPEDDFVCPVSGGLDSTILASLAKDRDASFVHSCFDVDTGDEEYFELVNEELGLDAKTVRVQVSQLIDEIGESVEVFEQPTSMIAIQAQNILFREIWEIGGESIILDGTGADELFYGYSRFTPYYIAEQLRENPVKGLKELKEYRRHLSIYDLKEIFRILTGNTYSNSYSIPELDYSQDFERPSTLEEAGESNINDYNFPHILHALEKSRAEYGHELRLPFLSSKLKKKIDEADPEENFDSGLTKYLLRDVFREEIPEQIFRRKKKTGFVELEASDIDNAVEEKFREVFQSESFRDREMFDGDLFYRRFEKGYQNFFKCYRFYCFEHWMRSFID